MQSNRPTSASETPYTETYPGGKLRGTPVKERLARRTAVEGECWVWQGAKRTNGYGVIGVHQDGKHTVKSTHRVAYEIAYGAIPSGLHIDHTCSNKACVNPDHLRAVPQSVNNQAVYDRGERTRPTHCKWGHEFTTENTAFHANGGRQCRECRKR